ncbi:MAG: hypothetical protein JAY99_05950 [Candidatus Thiodiazotropha lotti]|uniref:hypothetical protein n=1 Tax=Candidatus Thiodiazotropha endoloripes TaxID=1818881 RepID=UPI00083E59A3|nr:hypothetical protein [Candidatus Thiodiazotropha endoloripes]MCG7902674.1 hypothetical protein [Candidatus Thiodiazotropha weberae]MCG7990318.1 hypothetical protein [Candidatus Thiodiazotropha lotti]MCG7913415.1 hypothetical protein [Candidatus Thiodiazotropha weberae]MCG7999045.1 hypothetical protein [Candidatus Thiodiazotropha lotti]MCW4181972.1 hypothetical protein [Candidatus Thiodiazotropha weberae]
MRWIVIALCLSGCGANFQTSFNPASPYQQIPVGSMVVLKQALEVSAHRTRLFLQLGETMQLEDFDRYKANCNFELNSLTDGVQTIQPQTFTIKRVEGLMVEVVDRLPQYRFVSVGLDDQGTPMVTQGYHFWLDSTQQPEVLRLSCRGAFDDMWASQPPSIDEIQQTMGDLAEIQLAL